MALGTPARADIELGGKPVPRDKFIVYLFIGHSNMDGHAKVRDNAPSDRAWRYDNKTGAWNQAKDDGSCVLPFLNRLCEAYPDCHFGAIKYSVSAATVEARYRREGGTLYEPLIVAAKKAQPDATLGGLVALIGFAEAGDKARAEGFLKQLSGMMAEVREDLAEPSLPLVIGKYEEGARDYRPYKDVVAAALAQVPKTIERSVLVEKEGPYVDGHHYDHEGFRIWTAEALRLIQQENLFPVAAPLRVAIRQPANDARFESGAKVKIVLDAASSEGKVGKLTIVEASRTLAELAAAPYEFTWESPPDGLHRIHATATDDKGNQARSVSVMVAVGDLPEALIVPGPTGMSAADYAVKARVEAMGYLVAVRNADEVQRKDWAGKDVVLLPSSCHAQGVRKFARAPVPVVVWNNFSPQLRLGDAATGGITAAGGDGDVTVADKTLAGELAGRRKVLATGLPMRWLSPAAGGTVVAHLADDARKAAVMAFESGDDLTPSFKAPNRRVSMFMTDGAVAQLTDDGWKLFDSAVKWAAAGKPLPAALADQREQYDAWPADTRGLVFLWEDGAKPNRILTEGKPARVCHVAPAGLATYGPQFQMDTAGGSFAPEDADEALLDACRKSNEFTFEAVITPRGPQAAEARIAAFSSGTASCNFALSLAGGQLVLNLRTDEFAGSGARGAVGAIRDSRPSHVLVSCGKGATTCYINGRKAVAFAFDSLRTWEKQSLILGDEHGGGRNFRGMIEGLAIYSRCMDEDEAQSRWELYSQRLAARRAPPRVDVLATLVKASRPTDPPDTYKRCLVVNEYQVQQVLAGTLNEKRIQVVHWATLDGRHVEDIVGRQAGQTCQIVLEPLECHPQLEQEERNNELDAFDEPMFYDVTRLSPPLPSTAPATRPAKAPAAKAASKPAKAATRPSAAAASASAPSS